ncbi:dimethylaniline monooxygenase [N-oxide-forming] 5-like protein, partial [Leptotrombidium deliense]
HEYKTWDGFEDKNVVVIGSGASGADVATEVSRVANQVYLSARNGMRVVRRVWRNGIPLDVQLYSRIVQYVMSILPSKVTNSFLEYLINSYFDHYVYGLNPKYPVSSQCLTVNDAFANCILNGAIIMRRNVKEFTENGVIFEGFEEET